MSKREVYHYNLRIRGVFGRNRTVKTHTIKLRGDVPRDAPLDAATLEPEVHKALADVRAKVGCRWEVREDPIGVTDYPATATTQAVTLETYLMLSGRVLASGTV